MNSKIMRLTQIYEEFRNELEKENCHVSIFGVSVVDKKTKKSLIHFF